MLNTSAVVEEGTLELPMLEDLVDSVLRTFRELRHTEAIPFLVFDCSMFAKAGVGTCFIG